MFAQGRKEMTVWVFCNRYVVEAAGTNSIHDLHVTTFPGFSYSYIGAMWQVLTNRVWMKATYVISGWRALRTSNSPLSPPFPALIASCFIWSHYNMESLKDKERLLVLHWTLCEQETVIVFSHWDFRIYLSWEHSLAYSDQYKMLFNKIVNYNGITTQWNIELTRML